VAHGRPLKAEDDPPRRQSWTAGLPSSAPRQHCPADRGSRGHRHSHGGQRGGREGTVRWSGFFVRGGGGRKGEWLWALAGVGNNGGQQQAAVLTFAPVPAVPVALESAAPG